MNYFRLIRFQNLVMMALTLFLVKWCLVDTLLYLAGTEPSFSTWSFILLTLSTVLIAAGGYVINDYLDTDIDEINKPAQILVGKKISKNAIWNFYITLNITGLVAAVFPALEAGNINLVLIQIVSAGLLWFYSYSYKRQFLIGNFVISALTALVVLLPAYYEAQAELAAKQSISVNFFFVKMYIAFAFLTTFTREIIKDMEDLEGDESANCRTLPIVVGIVPAKNLAVLFSLAVMSGVAYIQYFQYESGDYVSLVYFLITVQIPSLILIWKTLLAKEKDDFTFAGKLSKVIMTGGILSMLVFKFTI